MSDRNYDALNAKAPAGGGSTTYLRLAHGALYQDKREWGKELRGFYTGHTLKRDPGNADARVAPSWKLQVWFDTPNGRVAVETSTNSKTSFGMLTCFLYPIEVDEPVLMSVWLGEGEGTANPPVRVALYRLDEAANEFKIVPKAERFRADGEFWSEREPEYLAMLRDHVGYQEPKSSVPEASEFDLTDEFLKSKGWPTLEEAPDVLHAVFQKALGFDFAGFENLTSADWNQARLVLGRAQNTPKLIREYLEANPAPAAPKGAAEEYDPFADE